VCENVCVFVGGCGLVCVGVRGRLELCVWACVRARARVCVRLRHCVLYEYEYSPWISLHGLLGYVLKDNVLIPREVLHTSPTQCQYLMDID